MIRPAVASTRREIAALRASANNQVAVVMTLGAIHEAHRELMREARRRVGDDGTVVVTIFVNPLQFGQGEDFSAYPRPLDEDLAACADEGVDIVFAPPQSEMYPHGVPAVTINPGPLGSELEGAARPTHFAGVLTVVAKLINITRPNLAVFGEKDYQQLVLVRRMVADLDLSCEIVSAPIVRDSDGLALSSRNVYLSTEERERALVLSQALNAGRAAAAQGPAATLDAATAVLQDADIVLDYLELRAPDLSSAVTRGPARLLVAARVGTTRLLDNEEVVIA